MVKAGIFPTHPICFLSLVVTNLGFIWVAGIGVVTLLVGSFVAIFMHDMKGLLALFNHSHLGLITLLNWLRYPWCFNRRPLPFSQPCTLQSTVVYDGWCGRQGARATRDLRQVNGMAKHFPLLMILSFIPNRGNGWTALFKRLLQ